MKSFFETPSAFDAMPADVGVALARVDRGQGREELYQNQVPELLVALSTQSKVESIRASNAIEGINVDPRRAVNLALSQNPKPRGHSEKEFAGYRDAVDRIMATEDFEPLSIPYILAIHRTIYHYTKANGGSLKQEDNLIVTRESGSRHIDFKPPPWQQTENLLRNLLESYEEALAGPQAHPLVLLSALILDFLAIHPVIDGNGRTARLITTHEMLRLGYQVARYSSVEQRIFETKNGYYDALRESQVSWHDGTHDIWPWTRYLIGVIGDCYDRFEKKVDAARDTGGMNKQERVRHWVAGFSGSRFQLNDVRRALPGISDQTIRLALSPLKKDGTLRTEGSGPGAYWVIDEKPAKRLSEPSA